MAPYSSDIEVIIFWQNSKIELNQRGYRMSALSAPQPSQPHVNSVNHVDSVRHVNSVSSVNSVNSVINL